MVELELEMETIDFSFGCGNVMNSGFNENTGKINCTAIGGVSWLYQRSSILPIGSSNGSDLHQCWKVGSALKIKKIGVKTDPRNNFIQDSWVCTPPVLVPCQHESQAVLALQYAEMPTMPQPFMGGAFMGVDDAGGPDDDGGATGDAYDASGGGGGYGTYDGTANGNSVLDTAYDVGGVYGGGLTGGMYDTSGCGTYDASGGGGGCSTFDASSAFAYGGGGGTYDVSAFTYGGGGGTYDVSGGGGGYAGGWD